MEIKENEEKNEKEQISPIVWKNVET